jgi:hypothetical protein
LSVPRRTQHADRTHQRLKKEKPMSHSHEHDHGISWPERIVLLFLLVTVALTAHEVREGMKAEQTCIVHAERFIEMDSGFALCERDDGSIVRRSFP